MSDDSIPAAADPLASPTPTKRKVRTLAEARALVEDWRASGLTQEMYVRERGLRRSTLSSCRRRVSEADEASVGFLPVLPPAPASLGAGNAPDMVLCAQDGVEVHLHGAAAMDRIPQAVAALRGAPR
jgi:hypothetical protein